MATSMITNTSKSLASCLQQQQQKDEKSAHSNVTSVEILKI